MCSMNWWFYLYHIEFFATHSAQIAEQMISEVADELTDFVPSPEISHSIDIRPRFQQAFDAFHKAGNGVAEQCTQKLEKQVKKLEALMNGKKEIYHLLQEKVPTTHEANFAKLTNLEAGDVIKILKDFHQHGCSVPKGTVANVVDIVHNGNTVWAAKVETQKKDGKVFKLQVRNYHEFALVGLKSIDSAWEKKLIDGAAKAVRWNEYQAAIDLLQRCIDLPYDQTPCDEEDSVDGWLARRKSRFGLYIERYQDMLYYDSKTDLI